MLKVIYNTLNYEITTFQSLFDNCHKIHMKTVN